jgi:hypothetical protein
MTMDFWLGFVMATLLAADCPIPTSPKSTVPGATWIKAGEVEIITAVPHPEIAPVTQLMTTRTRAVHRLFRPRNSLASAMRNLDDLCKLR